MKTISALALALAAVACASPAPEPLTPAELRTYPDARGMPADVQRFIVQWNDCSHWLGEHGWDEQRQRQIERAVRDVCPGVDAEAARLRARYSGNRAATARLAEYEALGQ